VQVCTIAEGIINANRGKLELGPVPQIASAFPTERDYPVPALIIQPSKF
jgi:hypothetical protein